MEYVLLGLIFAVALYLFIHNISKGKSSKELDRIRAIWEGSEQNSVYFGSVSKYANIAEQKFHRLTDQTIQDIDFNRLFISIDRTISKVGQQFLYKKLLEPNATLQDPAENLIELFSNNPSLRESVQLQLNKLSDHDAYSIADLLKDQAIKKPKWLKLLPFYITVVSGLILLSLKYPFILIALLIPMILNMFLHLYNKNNTYQFSRSIPQMNVLIDVSKELVKKGDLLYDTLVNESISNLRSYQRMARLVRVRWGGIESDFAQYLFDIIKVIFLIEVIMIFKLIDELKKNRVSILTIFEYVGNIDSSISVGSIRAGKLKTCKPSFVVDKMEIKMEGGYHPLVRKCIKNSITIGGRGILLTGSNMSGKSTFLRTLMINSILAQTIYTCFADKFESVIVKQFSSIRISDNLFEGKSYYFQEVGVIGSFIFETADTSCPNFFVLDEIFKGTNTVERIAAAKSILSYLNRKGNFVVASTHDIELTEMLDDEYELYHFTETIDKGNLHFDHTIKNGPLRTRNAIKLLELANYPSEIINEAMQITADLRTAKTMRGEV